MNPQPPSAPVPAEMQPCVSAANGSQGLSNGWMKRAQSFGWLKPWALSLVAFLSAGTIAMAAMPSLADAHTRAKLVVSHAQARPGDTIRIGVRLEMDPGWHTYWRNPGEAGGATVIRWELPDGLVVGGLEWPVPEVYELEGIYNYVYHDTVLLSASLRIPEDTPVGTMDLRARVEWLECSEVCVPGEAEVSGSLVVASTLEPSESAGLFEQTKRRLPRAGEPEGLRAWWEGASRDGETRSLILEWQGLGPEADFLGLPGTTFEVKVPTERLGGSSNGVRLRKEVYVWEKPWPSEIEGVLVVQRAPELVAYEVVLRPLEGGAAPSVPPLRAGSSLVDNGSRRGGLVLMLLFGLLGGLVLNLMPCVLPVIALKVLGFMRQAEAEPGKVRRHGLVYGLGVLASFSVLAGLVIAVQWGGRLASWGMQFQSPGFLIVMTTLVVLVALNLFGVFEVTLGGSTMGAATGLATREGDAGAFFNGVLATTLATPCTAPFLGTAVGYAFAQPRLVILLFFLVIGCGLALPYVVISFVPGLGRWLPRPGPWMERFKVAMGFPMLGAGVWLLSLLSRHYGSAGVLWLGGFLLVVSLAAWIWGQFGQRASRGVLRVAVVCAVLVALGYYGCLEHQLNWRVPTAGSDRSARVPSERGGINWQPWSTEALAAARATGHPVLVDFTADWCVTCQANKKTSLEIEAVRRRLEETATVALLGDYTLRDDAISRELRRFGRAGVPLVLVYPRQAEADPIILPELLTPSLVLQALDQAAR